MNFLRKAVTEQDWLRIFEEAKKQAIGEDAQIKDSASQDRARRFLSDYFFGKPVQSKREPEPSPVAGDYDHMNNDAFWELARKQLAERDRIRAAEASGKDELSDPGPVQGTLWPDLDGF